MQLKSYDLIMNCVLDLRLKRVACFFSFRGFHRIICNLTTVCYPVTFFTEITLYNRSGAGWIRCPHSLGASCTLSTLLLFYYYLFLLAFKIVPKHGQQTIKS